MAIEVRSFKRNRHNCNRKPEGAVEIIGSKDDGVFNHLNPIIVKTVCSEDEGFANIHIVGNKKEGMAVRLWDGDVHEDISDTSTPVLLKPGQILQIGRRGKSMDINLQPILVDRKIGEGEISNPIRTNL